MSLQVRLQDFITSVGTDYKQLRTWLTGSSTGDLTGLTTTTKTSIVAAVNEVNGKAVPAPSAASETAAGIMQIATTAEVTAGTVDTDAVSPLKLQQRLVAFAQPLDSDLTAIAALTTTTYGRAFLALANQAGLMGLLSAASSTVSGIHRFATQTETDAGALTTVGITPATFQSRLAAYAQPLSANLTALAGVVSGAFGRTLLAAPDVLSARTSLGLSAVAISGSASDITTGTLPTSVLPPIAINDTFPVASQVAMLALTAQRGDVAIRSDIGRSYILSTDSPGTLADWLELTSAGDVTSVAGRTGAVVLTKTDVGLSNVDNTSDANKPVSTAANSLIVNRLAKSANLSDVTDVIAARTNLSVYSRAEIGDPETDLVAVYTTAKA